MRRRLLTSVATGDLVALVASLAAATSLVFATPWPGSAGVPPGQTIWPLVVSLLAGWALGSTVTSRAWLKGPPRPAYGRALAIAGVMLAVASAAIVVGRIYWSRPMLGLTVVVWSLLALGQRAVYRQREWAENFAVVSSETDLVDRLAAAPHARVVREIDPRSVDVVEPLPDDTTLVVDLRAVLSDRVAQFVSSCNLAGVPVRTLGDAYEEHTGRYAIVHLSEGWELSTPVQRAAGYEPVKRLVDIALVLAAALPAVVLGLLTWVAVRLDSPGPGMFRQVRVGRYGKTFTLFKFRTMRADAERNGPQFAVEDDERATRVGRFIRKVRLDEIPQLWNVLIGDLSLVGPRPEQEVFVERFYEKIPFYLHRHLVRPGLTGWAQVNYGYAGAAETEEKLAYDLYYVKHMSLWLDLQILGKTLWTIVSGRGAR